jgi:hypothetical protein
VNNGDAAEAPFQLRGNDIGPSARVELERKVRVGSNWFILIAAFSILDSVVLLSNGNFHFVVGLGVTEISDLVANEVAAQHLEWAATAKGTALGLTFLAAAFFATVGFGSRRGLRWVFVLGLAFYAVDLVVLVFLREWLCIAFHGYALFRISGGLRAAWNRNALDQVFLAEAN